MKKFKKSRLIAAALGITGLMGAGTLLASCAAEEPSTPPASGQETNPIPPTSGQGATPDQQVQQAENQQEQQVKQAVAYAIEQTKASDEAKLTQESFGLATQEVVKYLKAPESDTEQDIHKTQRQQFDTVVKKIIDEVSQQEKQNFNTTVKKAARAKLTEGLDAMKEAASQEALTQVKKIHDKINSKVFDKIVEGLNKTLIQSIDTQLKSFESLVNNFFSGSMNEKQTNPSTETKSSEIDQIINAVYAEAQVKWPQLKNIKAQEQQVKQAAAYAIEQTKASDEAKLTQESFGLATQEVVKYLKAPESDTEQDIHKTQRQQFDTVVKKIIDEVSQQEKQNFNTTVKKAARAKLTEGLDAMKEAASQEALTQVKKIHDKINSKVFDKIVEGLNKTLIQSIDTQLKSFESLVNNFFSGSMNEKQTNPSTETKSSEIDQIINAVYAEAQVKWPQLKNIDNTKKQVQAASNSYAFAPPSPPTRDVFKA